MIFLAVLGEADEGAEFCKEGIISPKRISGIICNVIDVRL